MRQSHNTLVRLINRKCARQKLFALEEKGKLYFACNQRNCKARTVGTNPLFFFYDEVMKVTELHDGSLYWLPSVLKASRFGHTLGKHMEAIDAAEAKAEATMAEASEELAAELANASISEII